MRYFIRRDRNARVEGPLTVEALIEGIRDGRIAPDALASSDLGEGVKAIEAWRDCDWFSVDRIEDVRAAVPEVTVPPTPPRRIPRWVQTACLLSMVVSVYNNSERGWLASLWLWLTLIAITIEFGRYVWRRAAGSPAV